MRTALCLKFDFLRFYQWKISWEPVRLDMKVERNKKKSVQGFKIGIVLKKALNVL